VKDVGGRGSKSKGVSMAQLKRQNKKVLSLHSKIGDLEHQINHSQLFGTFFGNSRRKGVLTKKALSQKKAELATLKTELQRAETRNQTMYKELKRKKR
jgi:hypothetical protein